MIDYKDFVIPEFYWDYFVKEKKSLFINSYLRDNNILPSEDMIKNFIIDNKEREDFRRMLYSKYYISGIMPESPNFPILPDVPEIPNSGNNITNINGEWKLININDNYFAEGTYVYHLINNTNIITYDNINNNLNINFYTYNIYYDNDLGFIIQSQDMLYDYIIKNISENTMTWVAKDNNDTLFFTRTNIPEEIMNVNITFGINIEDLTPINNEVNDIAIIFKNGIKNLDLLEKDEKDVKININNDRYALTIESLSDFNKIYNIPIGRYKVTGYIGKLGETFNDNPIINFNETIDITFSGNIELHGKCNDILIISDNEFSVEISVLGKSDSHKYGEYYYYFENRIPGRNYIVTTKQQRISFSIDHYDKIQYYYIKE